MKEVRKELSCKKTDQLDSDRQDWGLQSFIPVWIIGPVNLGAIAVEHLNPDCSPQAL